MAVLSPLLALGALAGGGLAGYWLLQKQSAGPVADSQTAAPNQAPQEDEAPGAAALSWKGAAWFSALPGASMDALREQAQLAARAGIHQVVLAVQLPYPEVPEAMETIHQTITEILDIHPEVRLRLQVHLDPPRLWLDEHPHAAAWQGGAPAPWVSLSSPEWRRQTARQLTRLANEIDGANYPVDAFILAALDQGQWRCEGPPDTGPDALEAFGRWLQDQYADEAALRQAWDDPEAAFALTELPPPTDGGVFFETPTEQCQIDFRRFAAAEACKALLSAAAALGVPPAEARPVYMLTGERPATPSWPPYIDWQALLAGGIGGIAAPPPLHQRGAGESGGPIGPIDSLRSHGLEWMVLDDTRTGLRHSAGNAPAAPPSALRTSDVLQVQARNYALALSHDLEYALADPQGAGALIDSAMWDRLAQLAAAAGQLGPAQTEQPSATPAYAAAVACVLQNASAATVRGFPDTQRDAAAELRTALAQTGVRTHWILLSDLLAGRCPRAALYIFPDLYEVDAGMRTELHALLAQQGAAALWLYAPGAAHASDPASAISALTRIPTAAFEGPAWSGSAYAFDAERFAEGDPFGQRAQWDPLFYIETQGEEIGVLAKYTESGEPSAGIRFMQEGWASVYVAEPALTPALLRQVLRILEEPATVESDAPPFPVAAIGPRFIGLHGTAPFDQRVSLRFAQPCDVYDMLDESIGWPGKRTLDLSLELGETRLLRLEPVEAKEPAMPSASDDPEDEIRPDETNAPEAQAEDEAHTWQPEDTGPGDASPSDNP